MSHWYAYDAWRVVIHAGDGLAAILLEPHDFDGSREVPTAANYECFRTQDEGLVRRRLAALRVMRMIQLKDLRDVAVLAHQVELMRRRKASTDLGGPKKKMCKM